MRTNRLLTVLGMILLLILLAGSVTADRQESSQPEVLVDIAGESEAGEDSHYWKSCSYDGRQLGREINPEDPSRYGDLRRLIRPFYETLCGPFLVKEVPGAFGAFSDYTKSGERRILYDPDFLDAIKRGTGSENSLVSVLAHEIGHHILQHFARGGEPSKIELEADQWSGFFMGIMGYELSEATLVMKKMKILVELDPNYPKASAREEAIKKGYAQAEWILSSPSVKKSATALKNAIGSEKGFQSMVHSGGFAEINRMLEEGYWKTSFLIEKIKVPEAELENFRNLLQRDQPLSPEILKRHPFINEENLHDMKEIQQVEEVIKMEKFKEMIRERELKNQ